MSQEVIRKNLLDNIQKRADSIENLNVNVDDADADKLIKLYDPNNMNINIEETNKILERILLLPHLIFIFMRPKIWNNDLFFEKWPKSTLFILRIHDKRWNC